MVGLGGKIRKGRSAYAEARGVLENEEKGKHKAG